MMQPASRIHWSDPAVRRAFVLAALVVLLVLLPIVFGMHPVGSPSFDLSVDPAGPLAF